MIKYSNLTSAWPAIKTKLQQNYSGKLPDLNNVTLDSSTKEPGALGFVSTEDTDDDGKLDTIHIQSTELEKQLNQAGITPQDLSNIHNLDEQKLTIILNTFAEVLAHEHGHLKDFKPESENPFPGGEAVAEQHAKNVMNTIASKVQALIKIAQELDELGHFEDASKVDNLADSLLARINESDDDDLDLDTGNVIELQKFKSSRSPEKDTKFNWETLKGKVDRVDQEVSATRHLIVLDDMETYAVNGYVVSVTEDDFQKLESGELKVQDIMNHDNTVDILEELGFEDDELNF